jgi:hypothetical protein
MDGWMESRLSFLPPGGQVGSFGRALSHTPPRLFPFHTTPSPYTRRFPVQNTRVERRAVAWAGASPPKPHTLLISIFSIHPFTIRGAIFCVCVLRLFA